MDSFHACYKYNKDDKFRYFQRHISLTIVCQCPTSYCYAFISGSQSLNQLEVNCPANYQNIQPIILFPVSYASPFFIYLSYPETLFPDTGLQKGNQWI